MMTKNDPPPPPPSLLAPPRYHPRREDLSADDEELSSSTSTPGGGGTLPPVGGDGGDGAPSATTTTTTTTATTSMTTAALETLEHFRITRDACNNCSRKKRKCSGEKPCDRCKRADVDCTYSVRIEVGRGRKGTTSSSSSSSAWDQQQHPGGGGGGGGPSKKARAAPTLALGAARPAFSISPATGLAGLAESRYLSCFLEHVAPMYPVADDASIRDGLMYEFVGLSNRDSREELQGVEEMRGQALSCALFSCMAIGGLVMGCPPSAVANHMTSARTRLAKFRGLSEHGAVSALVLYGMANDLLPLPGANAEYRESVGKAQAIFEKLPDKDPLLSAVLAFLTVLDSVPLLQHVETACSTNPANGVRGRNTGTSYLCTRTTNEEATFQRAVRGRVEVRLMPTRHAPPVYVAADALLLSIRFSRDRGDVGTRLRHLHDFAASEVNRLIQEQSGAVAVLSLVGTLLGVQIRLGQPDGMMAAAKLTSALLHKCPGLSRSYHRHAAHLSLATFRLYGLRGSYDALRNLVMGMLDHYLPTFDEFCAGVPICELSVCSTTADKLLKMQTPSGASPIAGCSSSSDGASAPATTRQPEGRSAASVSSPPKRARTTPTPPPTPPTPPTPTPTRQPVCEKSVCYPVQLDHQPEGAVATRPSLPPASSRLRGSRVPPRQATAGRKVIAAKRSSGAPVVDITSAAPSEATLDAAAWVDTSQTSGSGGSSCAASNTGGGRRYAEASAGAPPEPGHNGAAPDSHGDGEAHAAFARSGAGFLPAMPNAPSGFGDYEMPPFLPEMPPSPGMILRTRSFDENLLGNGKTLPLGRMVEARSGDWTASLPPSMKVAGGGTLPGPPPVGFPSLEVTPARAARCATALFEHDAGVSEVLGIVIGAGNGGEGERAGGSFDSTSELEFLLGVDGYSSPYFSE